MKTTVRVEANSQVEDHLDSAKLLRRAAEEITRRGWCQRDVEDEDGKVCISGALGIAWAGKPGFLMTYNSFGAVPLQDAVQYLHEAVGFHPVIWNDAPRRTQQEVLEALLSTALQLEIKAFALQEKVCA